MDEVDALPRRVEPPAALNGVVERVLLVRDVRYGSVVEKLGAILAGILNESRCKGVDAGSLEALKDASHRAIFSIWGRRPSYVCEALGKFNRES